MDGNNPKSITENASLTSTGNLPVTVIILTLNEEENLPKAIESVQSWVDGGVFVVDSCSVDRTVDVALDHGVGIVQRPFTNYGDQWNWALERLPVKTPWVLKLDADEKVSAELREEMKGLLYSDPLENAFIIPIRLWFMGKRMHPKIYAARLWRKGKARFSQVLVNEHLLVAGATGHLRSGIDHMDTPNLHRWYEKQNRYSTMEAIMRVKGDPLAAKPSLFGTTLERRMFFKKIFYRIPFRYQLKWLDEAFRRRALLDGKIGLDYIRLRIEHYRATELKVKEMRLTGKIPELPKAPVGSFDPRVLSSALQRSVSP
ncbi:MAG TPA: glycosyltransferase family 2 protein [Thermodesulfobacteriota bacterium]|nr:glycosyltransferase family 2 protein [Thermodesulfobacteriota bacterium]